MARRSDPAARPKRRRGVLRHYRRPIWRDRLFWLVGSMSVLITALFVAVILVITGVPATPLGWARPVLLGAVVLLLSFRLLGAGVTTSRHFQRGLGEGSAPRPNDLEAKGRAAGAVVGRAVKAARGPKAATASSPAATTSSPAATPTPTPTTRPATVPAMNAAPSQTAAEPVANPATSVPAPIEALPAAPDLTRPMVPDAEARPPTPEPQPEPEPEPDPAPEAPSATPISSPEATPKVTADAAARSLGSMVGRRLAERRKKD